MKYHPMVDKKMVTKSKIELQNGFNLAQPLSIIKWKYKLSEVACFIHINYIFQTQTTSLYKHILQVCININYTIAQWFKWVFRMISR